MITTDDISTAVLARYDAAAAFAAAVPGGGWFGRGPDAPDAYPYAVHQIEAGECEWYSGAAYTQKFTVRVAAYAPVGAADPQAVALALYGALCTTDAQSALQAATLRNVSERVLHTKSVAAKGDFAPSLREGRDVFVCALTAELMTQGDRSAA